MEDSREDIRPERHLIMLIGLPGAGKTTYLEQHADELQDYTIVSIDGIAKERSKITGIPWAQIHDTQYDSIVAEFNNRLHTAVENGDNIIIEGVNSTFAKRAERLAVAKNSDKYNYTTTAILITPPSEEVRKERLRKREANEKRFSNTVIKMEPLSQWEFDAVEHTHITPDFQYLYVADNKLPSPYLFTQVETSREPVGSSLSR